MSLLVIALQLFVIYVPPVNTFFSVEPLAVCDLLIAVGAAVLVFMAMEAGKLMRKTP